VVLASTPFYGEDRPSACHDKEAVVGTSQASCGLPMVAAELDWMKAYDSVDRWVKEMALRRLGLQYDFIDFLLSFDRGNEQRVRTYYGDIVSHLRVNEGHVPRAGSKAAPVFSQ
jgi:hypothetical protein